MTDQELLYQARNYARLSNNLAYRLNALLRAVERKFRYQARWNPMRQHYSFTRAPGRAKKFSRHNHAAVRSRQVTGGNLRGHRD